LKAYTKEETAKLPILNYPIYTIAYVTRVVLGSNRSDSVRYLKGKHEEEDDV
jgi:hypothetical protein